ncbi:hypothetical protein [Archangium violaceum]|uniref:hypothetical protein n=1 Tax=Archangium violaceum TaxID=83451 RepID=UPI001363CAD4|nr:hypothetical protein [Archangium violaceum]
MHRGTASIVRALAPHFDLPPAEIAARLFRAPAVLATGLPAEVAEALAGALRESGLELDIEPEDAPLPEPGPSYDVAFYLRDGGRFREVARELALVLGCSLADAASALCATPATVLGAVSQATVDALRARFSPLGVEVDASNPATARYDVFYRGEDAGGLATVRAVLGALGLEVGAPPLVASGLSQAQAAQVWRELAARSLVRVVDQAFLRFDLSLTEAPATPGFAELLVRETGMPEKLVPRVLSRLPVVLHAGLSARELPARVAPLEAAGARVSAQLIVFRSFRLKVEELRDAPAVTELLGSALGLPAAEVRTSLARLPHTFVPPLGDTRARWLVAELRARGVRASLEPA